MLKRDHKVRRIDTWKVRVAAKLRPILDRWLDDPRAKLESDVLGQAIAGLPGDTSDQGPREVQDVFDRFTDKRASYMHSLHETKRRMGLLRAFGVRHPYWDVNPKPEGYRFVAAMGISHPEVYGRYADIGEVDPTTLPDRFLVKPVSGSTNRGVMGLDRQDDGTYVDRLLGRLMTWDAVVGEFTDHVGAGRITAALMVEELLRKPDHPTAIPDDFKIYCFYDRAELVMQRDLAESQDRTKWRFKFWNRDWEDVGPVKYPDRCDPDLARPVHAQDLIETAERLGKKLRLPFIRLDFYDTSRGVVFGEFSLNPGPPEVFEPDIDEYLGRHRELAAARLLADDIAAGYWDHLKPPSA